METGFGETLLGFRGEIAALVAAGLWAIASILYARAGKALSPLLLNLTKGFVAIALLLTTALLLNRPFPAVEFRTITVLALSGVIGIGLGDTFFFRTLTLLGPRRALLLESLAPPLSALIALVFLQEVLAIENVLGIFLTVGGVTWAVSERLPATYSVTSPKNLLPGIGFGLLAALGQAGGAVLSRSALAETPMDPLWSSTIRLVAGAVCLLAWLMMRQLKEPRLLEEAGVLGKGLSWQLLGGIAIAAFLGTYLAIWLQQISLKYSPTGISQALTSTSQLFVIPFAVALGDRLSLRALLGVAIALLGIALLFHG